MLLPNYSSVPLPSSSYRLARQTWTFDPFFSCNPVSWLSYLHVFLFASLLAWEQDSYNSYLNWESFSTFQLRFWGSSKKSLSFLFPLPNCTSADNPSFPTNSETFVPICLCWPFHAVMSRNAKESTSVVSIDPTVISTFSCTNLCRTSLSVPRRCNSWRYRKQLAYEHPQSAIFFHATPLTSTCNMPVTKPFLLQCFLPRCFFRGVGNSFSNCWNWLFGSNLIPSYTGSHLLKVLRILLLIATFFQTQLALSEFCNGFSGYPGTNLAKYMYPEYLNFCNYASFTAI